MKYRVHYQSFIDIDAESMDDAKEKANRLVDDETGEGIEDLSDNLMTMDVCELGDYSTSITEAQRQRTRDAIDDVFEDLP